MTRPEESLTEPVAEDPLPGSIPFLVGGNFISPAYYISQAIETVSGVDPFGWASQQVAGDWEAVKQAAGAAGNLTGFNTAFHQSVLSDWKNSVDQSWRGNAADGARNYFDQLAGAVKWQTSALGEIERTMNNIGNSMLNLSRVIGDLLQDIVDYALLWIAEMAAGAILSSTLVGAPGAAASYAVAAAHAVYTVVRIGELINKVTAAFKVIVGLSATAMELSSRPIKQLPALPKTSYDHPGA